MTKASSKPDAKAKEGETKNAASTASLAMVSDPISEKKPDIARNFSAVVGTRFEIPFDGTGWTYLGEQTQKEGIAYNSRRFDATSLVFLLDPTKAGDYILRFQKQDSLRGTAYEELVGVSVAAKPAAAAAAAIPAATSSAAVAASPAAATPASAAAAPASSTVAPASPVAAPASPAASSASPAMATTKPAAPLVDASTLATPEAALLSARSELEAGRPAGALSALDRFLTLAPGGNDEVYILYARALEKNGAQKDIKRAYAYYKKLRDEYPESPYWDEAAARCSYIERHYFEIR